MVYVLILRGQGKQKKNLYKSISWITKVINLLAYYTIDYNSKLYEESFIGGYIKHMDTNVKEIDQCAQKMLLHPVHFII